MDLTATLTSTLLENHRLDWLSSEFVQPAYENQSIANVPATLCHWYGIPPIHGDPLRTEIIAPMEGKIKRIILLLVDALALHQLQTWMQAGKTPVWNRLLENGLLAPLTSIVPSTTTAAMTTFWSGRTPAEHGVLGYELWLKEYGMVTNMIAQAPMSFKSGHSSLSQAGFVPENALAVPTLGTHLMQHGVQPYSFQHYAILHSGLSRTFMKDVSLQGYDTHAELWVNVRQLIDTHPHERQYIWVYTGEFDGLGHHYGPDDERAELAFLNFSHNFEHNFIDRLTPQQRDETLVLLTADHGQVTTPPYRNLLLAHHPEFLNALHIKPTGENRLAYLHVKPGKARFIQEYVEEHWPDSFYLYESLKLLESGLFGAGEPDKHTIDRIGDLTLLARNQQYLWWSEDENILRGRHGGLTPKEMLVPFLASHL